MTDSAVQPLLAAFDRFTDTYPEAEVNEALQHQAGVPAQIVQCAGQGGTPRHAHARAQARNVIHTTGAQGAVDRHMADTASLPVGGYRRRKCRRG